LSLNPRRTVRLYRGTKGPYVINVNQPSSELSLEIYDFIDCIRKDKKPRITGLDGKKAVEIVTAIYDYAEELGRSKKAPTI
jgi:predicted dehydrogenase